MVKSGVIAIIPARMASALLPGKPLAPILGIPMIAHCYFRTAMAKTVDETWVATCDKEIYDYVKSVGGRVVMTQDTHARAADRTAEALLKIEVANRKKADIVVMVPGDEPLVRPEMIDDAVNLLLEDPSCPLACLMGDIATESEFEDPNCVKVVTDLKSRALYFSRKPIPSRRKGAENLPRRRQVPIVPLRREYLLRFSSLPSSPLETAEAVDLLRCIEHGDSVKMSYTPHKTISVDSPQDLARAEAAMKEDPLVPSYVAFAKSPASA